MFGTENGYLSLDEDAKILTLPLAAVRPNPSQPRRIFERRALEELAESIRLFGVMQPIIVRHAGDAYEIIAGERRWRAAAMAGLTAISAIEYDADKEQAAYMSLIENLQRSDLHFFEEAESYLAVMHRYGITQEELAARIGKTQSTVANKLRVNRLSKPVKDLVYCTGLTERHARAVLNLEDEAAQLALLEKAAQKGLSVNELEKLVERTLETKQPRKAVTRLMRDYRLFVNTMRSAVRDLKRAGVDAEFSTCEENGRMVLTVVLPDGLRAAAK